MAEITDPVLLEAAGIDPALAPLLDKDLLKPPVYEADFTSVAFPGFNGHLKIRYATVGDNMDIEALCLGGGMFREAVATLSTCIMSAPASWYSAPTKPGALPVLNLRGIPDAEALGAVFNDYSAWRETFRTSGK